MKIVQISDTHISYLGGATRDSATRMIEFVNSLHPDFVIHTGDVTILDPDEDRDRVAAAEVLAGLDAPLKVLPGNHDVGEPGEEPFGDRPVTSERVHAFRSHFGIDHLVQTVGDWALIGVNSELFDSGLPEEEQQWEWIEGELPSLVADRPALFFTHKPVWAFNPEYQNTHLAIGPNSLPRLEATLAGLNIRAFGSGHLHHYAATYREDVVLVSAPSTAFVHRGAVDPAIAGPGLSQLGVVEYVLDGDRVTPYFQAPADLRSPEFLEVETARLALDAMGVQLPA